MVRTAIIFASDDKGVEPVFGIAATRRLALLLGRLGVYHIHVLGQVNSFLPLLSDLIPQRYFHAIEREGSLEEVVQGLRFPGEERVLVLKANLVADKNCLAHILESGKTPAVCLMTAAGAKGASDGLYLVDPDHLVPVLHVLWAPGNHQSAILGKVKAIPSINGLPYLIERTGTDARLSEEKLVEALAEETVADDGFIARHFDRRISRFISKRLANTWLTPNQITLAGMTIGLIGALLLAQPGYWPKLVGSLLFVCCVVVDGVDGEVARLKLKESRFGHYLDVVTDNIVHVAVFSGMAFGLYHDTGNVAYLHILLVLMGGFGLCAIAVYQCILRLDPGTMSESSRTVRLMALVTNRDFAYLVLLLAAIDRLPWFLLGAAVGSYFFAIALWCIGSHERRRRSAATNHQAAT